MKVSILIKALLFFNKLYTETSTYKRDLDTVHVTVTYKKFLGVQYTYTYEEHLEKG